jgi:hypothetical protein
LEKLIRYFNVEKEVILRTRFKSVKITRYLFVYFSKSLTHIGKLLGLSHQAASHAYQKGSEIEKKENISTQIF